MTLWFPYQTLCVLRNIFPWSIVFLRSCFVPSCCGGGVSNSEYIDHVPLSGLSLASREWVLKVANIFYILKWCESLCFALSYFLEEAKSWESLWNLYSFSMLSWWPYVLSDPVEDSKSSRINLIAFYSFFASVYFGRVSSMRRGLDWGYNRHDYFEMVVWSAFLYTL